MSRPFPPTVVTANDLRTGSVVYLGARGRWTDDLARARVAASAEALDELLPRRAVTTSGALG